MRINNENVEVSFSFTPKQYFLIYSVNKPFGKVWSLNPRIDRSYKGKDDDVGCPVIFLSDEEAETCKKLGFSWMEM